ncbi:alcohol dehydrogenase [Alkalispirochaeta americana]|uniref:Alcohol dehydrogenase n=1 Tax=Alkalispirochaeta americana TaxID=159291 RepID=A0A1N6V732_9SPIO|nr:iron-containing alcohol dehydrogenase [Alkalispirochaeta americana]SIQ73617.1 alcohol dehydrogenase [Alkalispirochaeta americana]
MRSISLRLPSTVVFGKDVLTQVGSLARERGTRALVVTEGVLHEGGHIERVAEILRRSGLDVMVYDELMPSSASSRVDEIASLARASKTQVVLGLGGMRVLSVARCVANCAASALTVRDLLEGKTARDSVDYIEVPSSFRNHLLMRDEALLRDSGSERARMVRTCPGTVKAVVLETEFSQTLSAKYALAAVMDTLLAAIEGFFSTRSSLYSDTLLERAIQELHGSALTAVKNPLDSRFRERAAEAGLMTALALAVTGQGAGGALAYGINARFSLPKSWVASIFLPHVVETLSTQNVEKAARVAAALGEPLEGISPAGDAPRAARGIRKLVSHLDLPARLRDLDVTLDELSHCAEQVADFDMLAHVPGGAGVQELQRLVSAAY